MQIYTAITGQDLPFQPTWLMRANYYNLLLLCSGFAFSRGSVIVEFILYIKTAKTEENRLEKLEAAISAHGTFGRYKAGHLVLPSSESTTFTTPGSSPKPTGTRQ
mgnify:CR=1 FL=1